MGFPKQKIGKQGIELEEGKDRTKVEFPIGRDRAVEFLATKRSLTRRGLVQLPGRKSRRKKVPLGLHGRGA